MNSYYKSKNFLLFSFFIILLARKGKSRIMSGSFFLMFFVVAIIIAVSVENFSSGEGVFDGKASVFSCLGYVATNTILGKNSENKRVRRYCAYFVACFRRADFYVGVRHKVRRLRKRAYADICSVCTAGKDCLLCVGFADFAKRDGDFACDCG